MTPWIQSNRRAAQVCDVLNGSDTQCVNWVLNEALQVLNRPWDMFLDRIISYPRAARNRDDVLDLCA
jgi:hypothetical protein